MKDTWNPWHGCTKISEGCTNCYMYYLDAGRGKNGSDIYRVKSNFNLPLKKDKKGNYKIKSGEIIRVGMTSDFFLEEADPWRNEVWEIIKERNDVLFFILTKRPERIAKNLPSDWGNGYKNVWINVTAENQKRADERIPILLDLPSKYKGIVVAPLLEDIDIKKYLHSGKINSVIVGGENYGGARVCKYDWVENIFVQCVNTNTSFNFFETGTFFEKDGKRFIIPKEKQEFQALQSGLKFLGEPIYFTYQDEEAFISYDILEKFFSSEKVIKCYNCTDRKCSKCSSY